MLKSRVMALVTATVIIFSISTGLSVKAFATNSIAPKVMHIPSIEPSKHNAIANDEKLKEMLKKNGTIPKDASVEESNKILKEYLIRNDILNNQDPTKLDPKSIKGLKNYGKEAKRKGLLNKAGEDKEKKKKRNDPQTSWDGSVTKDKALVLLIQFPNLPHNSLTANDTPMYYKDYSKSHFEDMIFGANGYSGPNGENLISLKQYYNEQSGKSYDIEGTVSDWYTSQNPAEYYGANSDDGNNSIHADKLIKEALISASKDINLKDYDLKDPNDLDGDGNLNEPDGIIDHLMIIHSGMGEDAGGGSLGTNAIWSHSGHVFDLVNDAYEPWKIPGTDMSASPYTIMPEDGAAGVFCHEFGHDLGLPDEYDTLYSGKGEPISYWSIMSNGSWSGTIPGTEPSGFSPYAKQYFQKRYGGNWQHGSTVDFSELTTKGKEYTLDASSIKGPNNDVVKVTLPKKATPVAIPTSGKYAYFGGKSNNLNNSMTTSVDLTNATSADFNFKAWYDIEENWDYASVAVQLDGTNTWTSIPGNITTTTDPNKQNPGNGITGKSNGWVDASFDLKDYIGKKINLKINYWTDTFTEMPGLYVDDIKLNINGETSLFDNAEETTPFTLDGFTKNDGNKLTDQYYLLEFRNHSGTDKGLDHLDSMSYNPGLLIWYADELYTDNWTAKHPGHGFLSVVDGDQNPLKWSDGLFAETQYQVHDATFSTNKSKDMFLDYSTPKRPLTLIDKAISKDPTFEDDRTYFNNEIPDAGVILPKLGIKVNVIDQTDDSSKGNIVVKLK